MGTQHTNKSIKELVNSRISGQIYRRTKSIAANSSKSSLQDIAESILTKHERTEALEEIFMKKSQRIEELNNAIVENSVANSNPTTNRIFTPTILQRLNPTKQSRKKAYVEVAKAQTVIAKEAVGLVEVQRTQASKQAAVGGFSRVPKFLKSY